MTGMEVHVVGVGWDSHEDKLSLIRQAVFTEEQGVPANLDLDGQDPEADHLLAINEAGQPIGCARLLPSGQIGRMAVMPDWRRRGIGSRLLAEASAGVSVPPDDADAFVAAIRALVDDPEQARALGASGRRWVVEHASPAAVGAAYHLLMNDLGRSPTPRRPRPRFGRVRR